jgi:DNA-directed RNA polymerase specialized sigma24 family protein
MEPSDLTTAVSQYRCDKNKNDDLYKSIALHVCANFQRYGFHSEEEAREIFADYFYKLPNLIERFSPDKREFEAYLASSLRFHKKTVYFREKNRITKQKGINSVIAADIELHDLDSDPYGARVLHASEKQPERLVRDLAPVANREASLAATEKRILFLGLKCSFEIGTEQLDMLSRVSGIPFAHIQCRVDCLKSMAGQRLGRLERLIQRRNNAFARISFFEHALKIEGDPLKREVFERKLLSLRGRLTQALARIKRYDYAPSNSEIAKVLGIPKGTVDSGLHYFRLCQGGLPHIQED